MKTLHTIALGITGIGALIAIALRMLGKIGYDEVTYSIALYLFVRATPTR